MPNLEDFLKETGEAGKDLIIAEVKELILSTRTETTQVIKETGELVEQCLYKLLNDEIDEEDFKDIMATRKRTVQQFLNSQQIEKRARLEKLSIALIDLVTDKLLDVVI